MNQDEATSEKNPGEQLDSGTAAEPQTGDKPAEAPKEYEIDIFRDWCKGCGICAAFCPKECLSLDGEGRPVLSAAWKCTGCRWCELHCPDFAICVREVAAKESEKEEAD